ncbi:hypothetical protein Q7M_1222 (plasmid) [Borrelia crocidurae str. Achema]|uniref:Uncharacterized protein n=1 Tax=Borrelia crocidurae (strain Achema) TaxID=1155096 RepID=I0FES3_BORCA|nr:hypothetical protein Q7M_1222 [Borrelia crocidurae str. Achema]
MSDKTQSKKNDETIVNFPILNSDDINYEYVSSYVKGWIIKKYTDNLDIKIQLVDNLYYNCKIKKYSLLGGVLETFHINYKEIFLGNLERKVVEPEVKLQSKDQSGDEVKRSIKRKRSLVATPFTASASLALLLTANLPSLAIALKAILAAIIASFFAEASLISFLLLTAGAIAIPAVSFAFSIPSVLSATGSSLDCTIVNE